MRMFSMLAIIIVLAIVLYNARNNLTGLVGSESSVADPGRVEEQVNDSLKKYQESLDNALKQSN